MENNKIMPETLPPLLPTKEPVGGNIFRKKRNEKAKALLAQILGKKSALDGGGRGEGGGRYSSMKGRDISI